MSSLNLPRLLIGFGVALLGLGSILLAGEGSTRVDVGPWGANFVLLGTIISASGFWLFWQHMAARTGIKVAGSLVALGAILLIVSFYVEPLLTRLVAVAALVSGVRGGAYHIGGFLPQLRHEGVMPLGEKAAMFSLLANSCIVVYLLYKSQALGLDASANSDWALGILTATALIVGGILVAESLVIRVLRKDEHAETLEDERDAGIKEEAARVAHALLITALVVLVVQLGIGGTLDRARSANDALGLSSPLGIAHALLALLFVSQCGKSISEIWLYRRART